MDIDKKTALITGCTPGGIGSALALELHARGYHVFATARDLNKLQPLSSKGIEILQLDVTDVSSIMAAKSAIAQSTNGRLHLLVSNAGTWLESPAIETELSSIRSMFDVNVFGPMEMVKQFTPLLVLTQGTIVNVGSILGIMPYPITAAYNASKAALAQYSETLRLELEPLNIKVVTVITGQVSSNLPVAPLLPEKSIYKPIQASLNDRAKAHVEKGTKPEAFAKALAGAVTAGNPNPWFWKGTNATITWLVSTFAPKTAFDPLMKKLSGISAASAFILARIHQIE